MMLLAVLETRDGVARVEMQFEALWEEVRRIDRRTVGKEKRRAGVSFVKKKTQGPTDSQRSLKKSTVKKKRGGSKGKFEFPQYIEVKVERERLVRGENGTFVRPGDCCVDMDKDESLVSDAVSSTGSMDDWIVADEAVVAALERKPGDEDSITSSQRWIYSGAELIRELRSRPTSSRRAERGHDIDDDTTSIVSRLSDATSAIPFQVAAGWGAAATGPRPAFSTPPPLTTIDTRHLSSQY